MHTLYESDTTKHSGIPGPLEGSSFNRKVSVAWNVTQVMFSLVETVFIFSVFQNTQKKLYAKLYCEILLLILLLFYILFKFISSPSTMITFWGVMSFIFTFLTHTRSSQSVLPAWTHLPCRPEARPCQSPPLEWGEKCLAAVRTHNTLTQWHFLSLLFHLHGHFSVSVHWFSTNHSHTHTHSYSHTTHIQHRHAHAEAIRLNTWTHTLTHIRHTYKHQLLAALQARCCIHW